MTTFCITLACATKSKFFQQNIPINILCSLIQETGSPALVRQRLNRILCHVECWNRQFKVEGCWTNRERLTVSYTVQQPVTQLDVCWWTNVKARVEKFKILTRFQPTFLIFLMTENFCVSIKLSNMTLIAMFTSSSVTYSLRCILACASAIRIIDSMWRTVIGMEPVAYKTKQDKTKLNCQLGSL